MLQSAVDSGQIRRFTGNDYASLLANGDIAACIGWSGDVVQLQLDNPDLQFAIPDNGGMIWTDNMLIPTGGDVFTASTFMNFVYDPQIAAQIEAYVNYICPVEGARDAMLEIDQEIAENELIFPSEETLAQVKIFDAEAADNQEFKEKFQAVTGA
jgi:spermidine/putrescine transport system substrate-binding protein